MQKINYQLMAIALCGLNANVSYAALESRANGTMVYDTDRNITWVANANLFKTLADASGNAASYVQSIILANNGVVHNTPNVYDGGDGVYDLTAADFNTGSGGMTWFGAMAWANGLNYGGYDDWRLPVGVGGSTGGYNIQTSEMGHLFYAELGGVALQPISTQHDSDYALFGNIQRYYWSGTEYLFGVGNSTAWTFDFNDGSQWSSFKNLQTPQLYAWAVRTGDVAAVPLPAGAWLFLSAILGTLALCRRRGGD